MQKPVVIEFPRKLTHKEISDMIQSALKGTENITLWGSPIWLGENHIHLYGAEKTKWIPVNIEIAPTYFVATFPDEENVEIIDRIKLFVEKYLEKISKNNNVIMESTHGNIENT